MKDWYTVAKFGDYQLFCPEWEKKGYINSDYYQVYINVYLNYPKFTYKRAFRFLYYILDIFKLINHVDSLNFYHTIHDNTENLQFYNEYDGIKMRLIYNVMDYKVNLSEEENILRRRNSIYKFVIQHFFGMDANIDYKALKRDVPLKPIKLL